MLRLTFCTAIGSLLFACTSARPGTSPGPSDAARDNDASPDVDAEVDLDVPGTDSAALLDTPNEASTSDGSAGPPDGSTGTGGRWEALRCERQVSWIWGSSADNVYFSEGMRSVLHLRPDGRLVVEPTDRAIGSIWGRSATEIYATSGASILRSRGDGTWTSLASINQPYFRVQAIFGDADSLFVTAIDQGGYGALFRYRSDPGWSLALRAAYVLSWWGPSNGAFYLGQEAGDAPVHRFDARTNQIEPGQGFRHTLETQYYGDSVWASTLDDAYVLMRSSIGGLRNGLFHTSDGTHWTLMNSPVMDQAVGIWGTRRGEVYVALRHGSILHFRDGTWTTEPTAAGELRRIWGIGSTIFAGGDCVLRRVP